MPSLSKASFIGSLDVGTTSSRFMIFNEFAQVVVSVQKEFEQYFPHPGWMEEKPEDLYQTGIDCIEGAVKEFEALGHKQSDIKTIGIASQRETTVVWSRSTGKPLYNAIVWPDTRNTTTVRNLEKKSPLGADALKAKTGLPISTYFAGVKFKWLLDNVPAVAASMEADDCMFGTVDTWVLWNLTGGLNGGLFYTDVTNASRTMFMSLVTLDWDVELLDFFGVKKDCLAKIVSNSEVYGTLSCTILKGTTISGLIGDQQSALVGNKCLSKGEAKCTYGTGAFMLYNTGNTIVPSTHGLLTTPAFKAGNAKAVYALEGAIAVAGSSVKWVRDGLGLIKEAKEIGELAGCVKDSGGVVFVTGFSGLFAPYWDDSATGMVIGITQYTTHQHIARATLEATCFQARAILDAMAKDSKSDLTALKVDGGMTESDICMQIQADILGITVDRPEMRESTALGAALVAGAGIGLFGWDLSRPETFAKVNTAGQTLFKSQVQTKPREHHYARWNRAVERSKGWYQDGEKDIASDDELQVKRGEADRL